jgi:hypothetical protein
VVVVCHIGILVAVRISRGDGGGGGRGRVFVISCHRCLATDRYWLVFNFHQPTFSNVIASAGAGASALVFVLGGDNFAVTAAVAIAVTAARDGKLTVLVVTTSVESFVAPLTARPAVTAYLPPPSHGISTGVSL